jgi:hypothetical protein
VGTHTRLPNPGSRSRGGRLPETPRTHSQARRPHPGAGHARENEEFAGNLDQTLALLDEAEKLLTETDREVAKKTLLGIQRRWDAIGKVPRDSLRTVEDRLRKVEAAVKKLDDDHWNKTDPEKVARSTGLAAQLTGAIEKLERELDAAKASGDARKIKDAEEALAARRIWLDALG